MYAIGIDIGGMSIKVGIVDENGKIIEKNKRVTVDNAEKLIFNVSEQINELLKNNNVTMKDIRGIGIGSPGIVDSKNGIVKSACNLPFRDFHIIKEVKKYFDCYIKLSNDANVAALGEAIFGCAKNYSDCVMLTLGTGVGGGIVIDKKLYEGGGSLGAELGHVTLVQGGAPCNCGRRGCIESYCSATALIRQTKEAMQKNKDSIMWEYVKGDINGVGGKTAFTCARIGDKVAQYVVDNFVAYLGDAIMGLCNIFRPQAVILGGGVSAEGDNLINRVKDYCKKYDYGYASAPAPMILAATLGNDAGIVGAVALLNQQ